MLFLLTATVFYGQRRPDNTKIKSLKVAFITERLSLTSSEAQVFWPIYNEYEQKREEIQRKERAEIYENIRQSDALSEREANSLIDRFLVLKDQKNELDREYFKKIAAAVTAKKTLLLFRAEFDFKRQLLKQFRNRQGGNR